MHEISQCERPIDHRFACDGAPFGESAEPSAETLALISALNRARVVRAHVSNVTKNPPPSWVNSEYHLG